MSLLEFRCRLTYPSGFRLDAAFATDSPRTALFGPSGSGKTTILSTIAGLRTPEDGLIKLGQRMLLDTAVGIKTRPEARHVGYVFQDLLLFPHLSVRDNLLYGWKRRPAAPAVEFKRAVEVLELQGMVDRLPHTLSGGERQRVALGRALLRGPELLLLDEPLAGLDQPLKERLLDYVERIIEEWRVPALLVTHDPAVVRRFAQRVIALRAGKVEAAGLPVL